MPQTPSTQLAEHPPQDLDLPEAPTAIPIAQLRAKAPPDPHLGPRDTRRYSCSNCPRADTCCLAVPGRPCPLERDAFPELRSPDRLPKLLRDAIAAEFRTYFRAKRAEAERGDKIDGEASKMLQGLIKAVEAYLDLLQRVQQPHAEQPTAPSELYPSLAAALSASGPTLFSEVHDDSLREQLRSGYIEAVEREDAILRQALDAAQT